MRVQSRRLLMAGGLSALAAGLAQAQRVATPGQTEGPYYPVAEPADADHDLVQVRGAAARAQGTVLHLAGRVIGPDGRPAAGASVEIWQCDANGLYHHPRERPGRRDGGFQGFGRSVAGADGAYGFRTIRPVAYPGRTPHIHFRVSTPAGRLTTQLYVAGEPGNAGDFLYRRLDRAAQAAITVALEPANGVEAGALAGTFDIVLGG